MLGFAGELHNGIQSYQAASRSGCPCDMRGPLHRKFEKVEAGKNEPVQSGEYLSRNKSVREPYMAEAVRFVRRQSREPRPGNTQRPVKSGMIRRLSRGKAEASKPVVLCQRLQVEVTWLVRDAGCP